MTTITFDYNNITHTLVSSTAISESFSELNQLESVIFQLDVPLDLGSGFAVIPANTALDFKKFDEGDNFVYMRLQYNKDGPGAGAEIRLTSSTYGGVGSLFQSEVVCIVTYNDGTTVGQGPPGMGWGDVSYTHVNTNAGAQGDPFITPLLI